MTFCGCNKRASAVFDHLHLRTSFIIESSRNYDRPKLQRELESSNYALSVLSKYLSSKNLETICYTTIEFKIRFDITSYGSRNMTSVSILHKNEIPTEIPTVVQSFLQKKLHFDSLRHICAELLVFPTWEQTCLTNSIDYIHRLQKVKSKFTLNPTSKKLNNS